MLLKTQSLTPEVVKIVRDKATEYPLTGKYHEWDKSGTYLCRQCGLALYRSRDKFHAGCGWPSFDETLPNAVKQMPDLDGLRTEILCARCDAHLGHIFTGEGFTAKNLRHCVNSASLDYVLSLTVTDTEEAIFAAGCFWGVEYYFQKCQGVVKTEVGYTGGDKHAPSYQEVCENETGHYEAIRVIYDPKKIQYIDIAKYFFEIHDPTQVNGQGPDLGQQYLSVGFYYDAKQKVILQQLLVQLKEMGYSTATQVLPVSIFWTAENYHQDYYQKTAKKPYCHQYQKRWS